MTNMMEYYRQISEIQKAVREREMYRLELEKERLKNAHRREKRHAELREKVKVLHKELVEEELENAKRVQLLLARVDSARREHQLLAAHTEKLKNRKRQYEMQLANSSLWYQNNGSNFGYSNLHNSVGNKREMVPQAASTPVSSTALFNNSGMFQNPYNSQFNVQLVNPSSNPGVGHPGGISSEGIVNQNPFVAQNTYDDHLPSSTSNGHIIKPGGMPNTVLHDNNIADTINVSNMNIKSQPSNTSNQYIYTTEGSNLGNRPVSSHIAAFREPVMQEGYGHPSSQANAMSFSAATHTQSNVEGHRVQQIVSGEDLAMSQYLDSIIREVPQHISKAVVPQNVSLRSPPTQEPQKISDQHDMNSPINKVSSNEFVRYSNGNTVDNKNIADIEAVKQIPEFAEANDLRENDAIHVNQSSFYRSEPEYFRRESTSMAASRQENMSQDFINVRRSSYSDAALLNDNERDTLVQSNRQTGRYPESTSDIENCTNNSSSLNFGPKSTYYYENSRDENLDTTTTVEETEYKMPDKQKYYERKKSTTEQEHVYQETEYKMPEKQKYYERKKPTTEQEHVYQPSVSGEEENNISECSLSAPEVLKEMGSESNAESGANVHYPVSISQSNSEQSLPPSTLKKQYLANYNAEINAQNQSSDQTCTSAQDTLEKNDIQSHVDETIPTNSEVSNKSQQSQPITQDSENDSDFFDRDVPLTASTAYKTLAGNRVESGNSGATESESDDIEGQMSALISKPYSSASRSVFKPFASSIPSLRTAQADADTDSVDSVEAAIQAAMNKSKQDDLPKSSSPSVSHHEQKPQSLPSDAIAVPAGGTVMASKQATSGVAANKPKPPGALQLKLDSDSESYGVSAGEEGSEDDFDFYD